MVPIRTTPAVHPAEQGGGQGKTDYLFFVTAAENIKKGKSEKRKKNKRSDGAIQGVTEPFKHFFSCIGRTTLTDRQQHRSTPACFTKHARRGIFFCSVAALRTPSASGSDGQ